MTTLKVTYRKSAIGYSRDQRATLAALGLKRLHQTVEHEATPSIRGMISKVRHLVSVDGVPADAPQHSAATAAAPTGAATPVVTEK